MEMQVKRLEDAVSVPVWSSEQRAVQEVGPDVLVGDPLVCVVRNRLRRAQQVSVARKDVSFDKDDMPLDGEGRPILAFLIDITDAAACIKAFPQVADSGMSAIEKLTATKKSMLGASTTKPLLPKELDPHVMLSRLEVSWYNCGRTASTIQDEVSGLLGKTTRAEPRRYRADSYPEFLSMFSKSPDVPTLIDVTVEGVHTFTIEMHSTSQFYLVQGYQGAYSAFWWQGLAERPQDLSLPAEASPEAVEMARVRLAPTREMRQIVGLGRCLDLDTLGTHLLVPLRALLAARVWGPNARQAWKNLPFFTNQAPDGFPRSTKVNMEDAEPVQPAVELVVSVVPLTRWSELYEQLGSARPASICGLIVARGLRQYEEYLALAKGK